jgi:predicted dehydrogenase
MIPEPKKHYAIANQLLVGVLGISWTGEAGRATMRGLGFLTILPCGERPAYLACPAGDTFFAATRSQCMHTGESIMNETSGNRSSRREFLKNTSCLAAATALAAGAAPAVHAGEDNTLRLALIGCGGRGTGAAVNALSTKQGPVKLVAMADVFADRLKTSHAQLSQRFADTCDVPEERRFLGFDAYRKAMDCLRPGDVAIMATPPAFRWVHFGHAIDKGLNVFMEKPVTVDGPTTRRMLGLAEASVKKNLKVGVGLMIRHCRGRRALYERIHGGEIGDIILLRAYRMHPPLFPPRRKPEDFSEVLWQVRNFHSVLWASGGFFGDAYVHQIDECSWMKGGWPVEARGLGALHYPGEVFDQNLDTYAVEYTYEDGAKLYYDGRTVTGCEQVFASFAHGTKGSAIITTANHSPGRARTFRGQRFARKDRIWAFPQPEPNPYQMEWEDLMEAIRQDKPYNEVERGAIASLVTSMGRMAAHTGQVVTYDEMLNCEHEFAPSVDKLTEDGPAPVMPDAKGNYPRPMPGMTTKREY